MFAYALPPALNGQPSFSSIAPKALHFGLALAIRGQRPVPDASFDYFLPPDLRVASDWPLDAARCPRTSRAMAD